MTTESRRISRSPSGLLVAIALLCCALRTAANDYRELTKADIGIEVQVVDQDGAPLRNADVWRLVDPVPQIPTNAPIVRSIPFDYLDRVADRYRNLQEFARPWRPGFFPAVEAEVSSLVLTDSSGKTKEIIKFPGGRPYPVTVKYTALAYGYVPSSAERAIQVDRNRDSLRIVLRRDSAVAIPGGAYWQAYWNTQREYSGAWKRDPESARNELLAAAIAAEAAGDRKAAARTYCWIPFLPTLTRVEEGRGAMRVSGYTREDEFSERNVALLEKAALLDPQSRYIQVKLLLLRPPADRQELLRQMERIAAETRNDLWPDFFARMELTYLASGQRAKAKAEFESFLAHEPSDWRNRQPYHFEPRRVRYASLSDFIELPVEDLSRRLGSVKRDAMGLAVRAGRVDLVDWSLANGALTSDLSDMMPRAISSRRPEMVRRVLDARNVAPGRTTVEVSFELQQVDQLIDRRESDLTDLAEIRRLIAAQNTTR